MPCSFLGGTMYQQELVSAKYFPDYEATLQVPSVAAANPESSSDEGHYAKTLLLGAILVIAAVASFFLLPFAQALMIPQGAGGVDGPSVIRPLLAAHVLGSLFIGAMTALFASVTLGEGWSEEEPTDVPMPPASRPSILKVIIYIWFVKCFLVCGIFLVLYLDSWCVITADGIRVQQPLGARNYSFAHIRDLRLDPRGHLPFADKDDQYGYTLEFIDGRTYYFNLKNEGLGKAEMTSIASFLSEKTGKPWRDRPASKGRQQFRR